MSRENRAGASQRGVTAFAGLLLEGWQSSHRTVGEIMSGVQRGIAMGLLVLMTASCAPAPGDGEEPEPTVTFDRAVEQLIEALKKAAPEGVTCDVHPTTPKELGWTAAADTPAWTLTLWTPSGAARAFGLLPRKGTYYPIEDKWPQLITIDAHLVIVSGPQPEVALTLEAMEEAQPLLNTAAASINSAAQGEEIPAAEWPKGLTDVRRVVKYAHYLEVELAPGQTLDENAIRALGRAAVAYRVRPMNGPPPAHTVEVWAKADAPSAD